MNKSLFKFWSVVLLMFFMVQPSHAQLGKIFKKVTKSLGTPASQAPAKSESSSQKTAVAIPSGGTMVNAFSDVMDVELVGAYGKSTSENYGTIGLVLKIKMKANEEYVSLGGNEGFPNQASTKLLGIDQDGQTYIADGGSERYNVTEGVFIKVDLGAHQGTTIQNVKKTATTLQVLKVPVYIDAKNRGYLTFRDVPVVWDGKSEK